MPLTIKEYWKLGCGRCHLTNTPDCKIHSWSSGIKFLRKVVIEEGLEESIKWGSPAYSHLGKIIVLLSVLKDHFLISFPNGALLLDPDQLLTKPGENTQAGRVVRFFSLDEAKKKTKSLQELISQAKEISISGKSYSYNQEVPKYTDELSEVFEKDPEFEKAFQNLTTGRQRGYILYFSQAKQSQTKMSRIAKSRNAILAGKGWNERYHGK